MAHQITALIIQGEYNREQAAEYDLRGITLESDLTLFFIDVYYTAYWQHSLDITKHLSISPPLQMLVPTEGVIAYLIEEITSAETEYTLISTDYCGGSGFQYAVVLQGRKPILSDPLTINEALIDLGVKPEEGKDAFDTIGLAQYRESPAHLNKYQDLCDELGR